MFLVFVLIIFFVETISRTILNTGMQYDLEMWKYAKYGKQVAMNKEIGHVHKNNSTFHAMGVDVNINSMGHRDHELSNPKKRNELRLIMVGDSITFGWGVPQDQTVSARMEKILNTGNKKFINVVNTGIGNTNTSMQVEFFIEHAEQLEPDYVVLNYFINDAEKTPAYKPLNFLSRYSYGYIYMNGRWDTFKRMLQQKKDWKQYYLDLYNSEAEGWLETQKAIIKLKSYCAELDIPLLIVNYPEMREFEPYPFKLITTKIGKIAQTLDISFLDLLPSVSHIDPEELWVTEPDPHPNAKADDYFAKAITEHLESAWDYNKRF
ncbi:MAG: SGNH/GDSL hydrolase family protein [Pseudomonadota bacterium]